MEPGIKGRCFYDTDARPPSVTFDDGKDCRRNFPWMRYAGSHWSYAEADVIRIEIDEWVVLLKGHNLAPLFAAIQAQTLKEIGVHPEWENEPTRANDTFATKIQFAKLAAFAPPPKQRAPSQMQMRLG